MMQDRYNDGGGLKCDFCSAMPATWRYPCRSFTIEVNDAIGLSEEDWAACDVCHNLIEMDAYNALTARSVSTFIEKWPITHQIRTELLVDIGKTFDLFKIHRLGPAKKIAQ